MPKLFPHYREEIRRKIIFEAFEVFIEKGYEKTTMDDIAARLGVTKPAIYRYFKNKDELFLESIAEMVMTEYKNYLNLLFTGDDIMAGANKFFDAVLEFSRKYHTLSTDVFTVIRRNRSFLENSPGYHQEMLRLMQVLFKEQYKKGSIHTDLHERELAILLGSIIEGLIHLIMEDLDPDEAKEVWLKGFAKLIGITIG
jgi:AcrR family transcriptional regulator